MGPEQVILPNILFLGAQFVVLTSLPCSLDMPCKALSISPSRQNSRQIKFHCLPRPVKSKVVIGQSMLPDQFVGVSKIRSPGFA